MADTGIGFIDGSMPNTGYSKVSGDFEISKIRPVADSTVTVVWTFKPQIKKDPKGKEIEATDHFELNMSYTNSFSDKAWIPSDSKTIRSRNTTDATKRPEHAAEFSVPSTATKLLIKVTAIPKSRDVNGKDTPYWTGTKSITTDSYTVPSGGTGGGGTGGGGTGGGSDSGSGIEVPSVPTVTIKDYQLTAEVTTPSASTVPKIQFQIVEDNSRVFKDVTVAVNMNYASITTPITAGKQYKVRARSVSHMAGEYSEWSDYSGNSEASVPPSAPHSLTAVASSATEAKLTWSAVENATGYDIEYSTDSKYFDTSSATQSISVKSTTGFVTGLETGKKWYFRVRATNQNGESSWSNIVSTLVGKKPSAPTTWARTTTITAGDICTVYWVHNSQDNSAQTAAQIEFTVYGQTWIQDIKKSSDGTSDAIDQVQTHWFDTSGMVNEGGEILWRVRTKGALDEWSDWSIQRTIHAYAPPTLTLELENPNNDYSISHLPIYFWMRSGPYTQEAVTFSLEIIANDSYDSYTDSGISVHVHKGEIVFSRVYNADHNSLRVEISAEDVTLCNEISYTAKAVVGMNSGLSAEDTREFTIQWGVSEYSIDMQIGIDYDNYTAEITPFAVDENGDPYIDTLLSVYRREYDGDFTPIIKDVDAVRSITTVDPHVTLDYARYRVVGKSKKTGEIIFEDMPGIYIGCPYLIMQWDEDWSEYYTEIAEENAFVEPVYTGSILKIKGNIDINDNFDPDSTLVNYIGRKHPVGYYGTQRGVTTTWSAAIPKEDVATLYTIRRLAVWNGNVYVREPSGTGYWANVKVSYSRKHVDLIIPVTFEITRVEGGE